MHIPIFTAALFMTVNIWTQPKILKPDAWIKNPDTQTQWNTTQSQEKMRT